jgi:hypothetical protein
MGFLTDAMLDNGALGRRIGGDPWLRDYQFAPRNLLTAQQASLEDASLGVQGWIPNNANATIARDATHGSHGTASVAMTATVTAGMAFVGNIAGGYTTTVIPGRVYTAHLRAQQGIGIRGVRPRIYWYTAAGVFISPTDGTYVFPTTSTWTTSIATSVAPATAGFAVIYADTGSGQIGDVVYVDCLGLWEGAGGSWVPGGERLDPGTLGHYWDESVGRREFSWQQDSPGPRWVMTYGDTGWRDITLENGWAVTSTSNVKIRREGSTVSLHIPFSLTAASKTTDIFYTLPAGFAPTGLGTTATIGLVAEQGGTVATFIRKSGSALTCVSTATAIQGVLQWSTTDAWPTSLPGVAFGSIPIA